MYDVIVYSGTVLLDKYLSKKSVYQETLLLGDIGLLEKSFLIVDLIQFDKYFHLNEIEQMECILRLRLDFNSEFSCCSSLRSKKNFSSLKGGFSVSCWRFSSQYSHARVSKSYYVRAHKAVNFNGCILTLFISLSSAG